MQNRSVHSFTGCDAKVRLVTGVGRVGDNRVRGVATRDDPKFRLLIGVGVFFDEGVLRVVTGGILLV